MKLLVLAAAAALLLAPAAAAQTVSVGTTNGQTDTTYVNGEWAWDVGNDVEAIVEGRLRESNSHLVKVGVQREFVDLGLVKLAGRLNLTQTVGVGKDSTGVSIEPTASFNVDKAKVTVGYEMGDSFRSRDNGTVRTSTVLVMYPFTFGNFGLQYENERGDLKQESVSLVYSLKQ
jgi:opacity protein-like surface antigen